MYSNGTYALLSPGHPEKEQVWLVSTPRPVFEGAEVQPSGAEPVVAGGTDALGAYTSAKFVWNVSLARGAAAVAAPPLGWTTTIRVYDHFVVFGQAFSRAFNSSGVLGASQPLAAFPSFNSRPPDEPLGTRCLRRWQEMNPQTAGAVEGNFIPLP